METVEWPKEWAKEEGWPSLTDKGTPGSIPLTSESRLWVSLSAGLARNGVAGGVSARTALLGGPDIPVVRTIEQVRSDILEYFSQTKKRPSNKGYPWNGVDQWLRRQKPKMTLASLCDLLGISGRETRTLESTRAEIQAYFDVNGVRPSQHTSTFWKNVHQWAYTQGSSLRKVCDDMGLSGQKNFSRNVPSIKVEIEHHYRTTGEWPTQRTSDVWKRHSTYLYRQGVSLGQLCAEVGAT